jgi:hypothetical protein
LTKYAGAYEQIQEQANDCDKVGQRQEEDGKQLHAVARAGQRIQMPAGTASHLALRPP